MSVQFLLYTFVKIFNMNSPRERVLETASFLFHQQGYKNTGVNQIIKE